MPVLFKIIKKNLKLLIRSKSSSLIVILGPLLIIFLVGIAFGNVSKFSLNIGTYSSSYTELTNSFITKLEEKEFRVQKIDSEELCIEQIKQGKIHTCIIFPPDISLEADKINEIIFYVDYSKVNLIYMVLDTLSTKLTERSEELSLDLTTNLLNKIETTKTELYNKKPVIINLKTDNQEIADQIAKLNKEIISKKLPELKETSSEIKDYILEKIKGANKTIKEVQKKIDSINSSVSNSTINSINQKLSSIDTYLYNIYSKIEDPNNMTDQDWAKLTNEIDEIDSTLSSISYTLSKKITSSTEKINQIQESVDKIYNDLESIQIKQAATIVNPITTTIKTVMPEKSYLNYLFPALIVLVVMFISILLSTTLVMMEKHSPAYFRNFITPVNDITFIFATFLTNILLVSIQLVIIILISIFFFKAQIISTLLMAIPILLLITVFFTLIGMAVGHFFRSEETATLASISIGSIFLFLSDIILPLESMPDYIRNIAYFNPFVLGEMLLRKSILFKAQFPELANEIYLLIAYSAVLFIIIWISQKITRKHLFYKKRANKKKTIKQKK